MGNNHNLRNRPRIQLYELVNTKALAMATESQTILNYLHTEVDPVEAAIMANRLAEKGRTIIAIVEPDPHLTNLTVIYHIEPHTVPKGDDTA